jgi:ketosteroid isomerase-like protein
MKGWPKFGSFVFIIILLIGGCASMSQKNDPVAEKAKVEEVIKNSIRWAINKDTVMSYNSYVQDSTLFYFSPDDAGTVIGFDQFKKLTEELFMNPLFKAISSDFKQMRVDLSHSGDVAWWSCYLDDFNEWDGKPANWENVRWTGVLEKINGEWKIRQMHFSHSLEAMKARYQKAIDDAKAGK